jgi:AcrR family transcriptional regulator
MDPDQRRAAILEIAREEFGQRPYAAVSMAGLATAAGVSAPLVVFYFGSKQKLYLEVIRTAVEQIAQGLEAVPGPPSLDRLEVSAEFYARYALEHPWSFQCLVRGSEEESQAEAKAMIEQLRVSVMQRLLADLAVSSSGLDPASPVTELAARSYLGYVDTAVIRWLALPETERAGIGPEQIARLARGAFGGSMAALGAVAL